MSRHVFTRTIFMAASLVELPEVERLSPLVIRILGGNPGKVYQSVDQTPTFFILTIHSSLFKVDHANTLCEPI